METITFHCKVITPMFLAGADGRTPELRPPSIKGAMRFWWRAMNGHLIKDGKLDDLIEEEGKIFGDTKQRSSIVLTCEVINKKRFTASFNGDLRYMAFGAESRTSFGVGTVFNVCLSSKNQAHLKEAKRAFSLLTHLGGLGAKSRNGFGAFTCEDAESFDKILQYDCFNNLSGESSFTSIGDETEIYRSVEPQESWRKAIGELKKIYADNGKKKIPKKERVYIAAPFKKISPPDRHAKIHLMSVTTINDELHYTITFLPYNYLVEYHEMMPEETKKRLQKWKAVLFGKGETIGFNESIFTATNTNGENFVIPVIPPKE